MEIDFTPFLISLKLAFWTTLILFFISVPLGYFVGNMKGKLKPFLEAIFALPIVLPPTVLGYYLLIGLSGIDKNLVFSFEGILIASIFYSFPFMFQPIQSAIENFDKNLIEASYILKKTKLETLFYVILPNIKPALFSAIIITFAHTVGEFGVVLMVGGSIPGSTKVASVAIYEMVETLDYQNAHIYSAIMVGISFLVLVGVYLFNQKHNKKFGL